jgi:hypothetical protein
VPRVGCGVVKIVKKYARGKNRVFAADDVSTKGGCPNPGRVEPRPEALGHFPGTLQTCRAAAGPPKGMEAPPQTVGVSSASPTTDPTPSRGGRAASAARACFEFVHDEVNSAAVGSATVETGSLRCKICRGRGGTEGSLRESGQFVAARPDEHMMLHCLPERSRSRLLEQAETNMSDDARR